MPRYEFTCPKCETQFDRVLSFADRDQPQACTCGEAAKKALGTPNFVLRGDGWTGKNIKIQGQMTAKNRHLTHKSKDRPTDKLVPNVGGEEVGSWKEAKHVAASKGKDTSSYDALIRKEKVA